MVRAFTPVHSMSIDKVHTLKSWLYRQIDESIVIKATHVTNATLLKNRMIMKSVVVKSVKPIDCSRRKMS